MLFGQTGNRLSFVNGTAPQPQLQIVGNATVESYLLKSASAPC